MAAIEPNWISLLWFAAFATICTVAFLVVAGMFPLALAPERGQIGRRDIAGRRQCHFIGGASGRVPDSTAMPSFDGAR